MADTVKKDEKTTKAAAAAAEASPETPAPETTTANDGALAINQEKTKDQPASSAEPDKTPVSPAASTPAEGEAIVVSAADVAAIEKDNDPHQSLSEQIEVLTGEVQALQAKIEKLTSGVSDPAPVMGESVPLSAPVSVPPTAVPLVQPEKKPEEKTETPKTDEESIVSPPSPTPPVADSAEPTVLPTPPASPPNATVPVNDIYSKILAGPNQPTPVQSHKDLNDDATIEEGSSGIGTIGEVLIVFGFIALLILGASPFLKEAIGGNWEALKSIGWPTATISLALGFFLFLFNKSRVLIKIFALLLTLIAALMTAAVFDYGSMLGPLSSLLEPIASFYK